MWGHFSSLHMRQTPAKKMNTAASLLMGLDKAHDLPWDFALLAREEEGAGNAG